MKYIDDWDEDLIRCPSQIQRHFEYNGETYTIYLRWRWDDPWSAQIITPSGVWLDIDVCDYSHDEYPMLEREVMKIVEQRYSESHIADSDLRISVAKLREVLEKYMSEYDTNMSHDDADHIIEIIK